MKTNIRSTFFPPLRGVQLTILAMAMSGFVQAAQTPLADIPIYSATNVPANLMLALSVEFPTGTVAAYTDNVIPLVYTDSSGFSRTIACGGRNAGLGVCYFPQMKYLGYFDFAKCYTYNTDAVNPLNNYFIPVGAVSSPGSCGAGLWSGNMLNWATMTALDEFRQTLTGGNRLANSGEAAPPVHVDAPDLTVLQRSRQTAQGAAGNNPTKWLASTVNVNPSTVVGDLPFATAANVYIRSHNGSTELQIGSDPASRGVLMEVADNSSFTNNPPSGQNSKLYYVRVQVCAAGMLESNCNQSYRSSKPEGLIQQNFTRIRVGATGYLVALGVHHPNGILRALLRDNGPTTYNGFGARKPNTNAEWDQTTGVLFANPDPDEATPSGVSMSGAINYLNQFGYVEPYYETNDTIAELYWATLAYYKNVPLDASYTATPTAGDTGGNGLGTVTNSIQLDGFPAIADPTTISGLGKDPIEFSCQGNAIVTIGDSHTWCDTRIPGSNVTAGGSCSNQSPLAALAANGTDPGLNTAVYLKQLGNLPLIEAIGASPPSSSMATYAGTGDLSAVFEKNTPPGASYNMAGMAYYAHTQDIRADDTSKPSTLDKQTVDTYTVDVMEPGSYDGSTGNETYNPSNLGRGPGPNMYWLAAKYGGFDDVNQDGKPASFLTWHTNGSTVAGKDLRPDNYFPGNRPDLIRSGLSQIFNRVSSTKVLSAAPPGISALRTLVVANPAVYNSAFLGSGFINNFPQYVTTYRPGDWSGNITGQVVTGTPGSNTTPVGTPWSAQSKLDNLARGVPIPPPGTPVPPAWSTGRRIVTFNGTNGVPFRYDSLSGTQKAYLVGDSSGSHPLLDFLRGDSSNEGALYRNRRHILGDIVDSTAFLIQSALSPGYSSASNPGYAAFASSLKTRAPVVYVGSNDGMVHAFAADFSLPTAANPLGGGGSELFAYVPSFTLAGPSGTPLVDGLAATANLAGVTTNRFNHHFYVNATPQVADADFDWTCNSPGTACSAGALPAWHTMLVGALGKGGRGIYALDITTVPPSVDATNSGPQESAISRNVLWEFTAPDLGFSYGRPTINKTKKYGWVVLVTTGYDNTGVGQDGRGKLYVLNAKTGVLLETIDTGVGSTTTPSGLGRATPYTQNLADGTVESVYAGDLLGNVWRFDLSGTGAYAPPVLLAKLTDPVGNPQPITTAPRIEDDIDSTGLGTRRWVFVGTGKFLDTSDLNDTQQQTMYALRDGTSTVPNPATGGPFPLPLTRSALTVQANLLNSLALTDGSTGWFYDLTQTAGSSGATERIVVDPDTNSGFNVVAWATLVPTKDPCQFQGAIYAAGYGTGQSAILDAAGTTTLPSIALASAVTGVQIVQLPDGNMTILAQNAKGETFLVKTNPVSGIQPLHRTNWREILN